MSRFAPYEPDPDVRPPPFAGRVRLGHAADAEAIAEITAERDEGDAASLLNRTQGEFEAAAAGEPVALFVAEEDGAVVGFGRVRREAAFEEVQPALRPPVGWYLLGVIVAPTHRRRGIARAITLARLDWIAHRADEAYYFLRATNRPSIDLHAAVGFVEVTRRFVYPRTGLGPGEGILYRVSLRNR